jgi:putative transposase
MKARHNYRLYPTDAQAKQLAQTFGCVRYVYNWALNLRSVGFKNGEKIGYAETSAALTKLNTQPDLAWLNEVSSVPLQQVLRDLQTAYKNFFDKRTGYPAFKRKDGAQGAEYTKSGFKFDLETRTLSLAKIGEIKVKWSRQEVLEPSSVRILRDASGRYFASFVVEVEPIALPITGETVGVDFGLNRLATLSTGERIANPKHSYKYAKRMATLQRRVARKKKGSNRRKQAVRCVAKLHAKIADTRKDAAHKFSTSIIKRFDAVYIEDLHLRGMVKNHSLARSVSDAGIGMITQMLASKAERYGRTLVKVDRWFPSSKMCSGCGHINKAVVLGVKDWTCPACGVHHDRDDNAATNIKAAGLAVSAHGGTVRPGKAAALQGKSRRSANLKVVKHENV